MMQPIGLDETNPGAFGPRAYEQWGTDLRAKRPDISAEQVTSFGQTMWDGEFVLSVRRDFLSTVQIPLLVLPGNDMAHPTGVGLEVARLLPHAELLERWKEPEVVPATIERMRSFLQAHTPSLETA
jgi:hypothetical protein